MFSYSVNSPSSTPDGSVKVVTIGVTVCPDASIPVIASKVFPWVNSVAVPALAVLIVTVVSVGSV